LFAAREVVSLRMRGGRRGRGRAWCRPDPPFTTFSICQPKLPHEYVNITGEIELCSNAHCRILKEK
jgi:hypothetical protein